MRLHYLLRFAFRKPTPHYHAKTLFKTLGGTVGYLLQTSFVFFIFIYRAKGNFFCRIHFLNGRIVLAFSTFDAVFAKNSCCWWKKRGEAWRFLPFRRALIAPKTTGRGRPLAGGETADFWLVGRPVAPKGDIPDVVPLALVQLAGFVLFHLKFGAVRVVVQFFMV